jgi:hypothetical protein
MPAMTVVHIDATAAVSIRDKVFTEVVQRDDLADSQIRRPRDLEPSGQF